MTVNGSVVAPFYGRTQWRRRKMNVSWSMGLGGGGGHSCFACLTVAARPLTSRPRGDGALFPQEERLVDCRWPIAAWSVGRSVGRWGVAALYPPKLFCHETAPEPRYLTFDKWVLREISLRIFRLMGDFQTSFDKCSTFPKSSGTHPPNTFPSKPSRFHASKWPKHLFPKIRDLTLNPYLVPFTAIRGVCQPQL